MELITEVRTDKICLQSINFYVELPVLF